MYPINGKKTSMFRTFKLAIALNLLGILFLTGCGDSQTDNVEPQTISQTETTTQDTEDNEQKRDRTASVANDGDATSDGNATSEDEAVIRRFQFTYAGKITGLDPDTAASIWLPVAQDTHNQKILNREVNVPGRHEVNKENNFGNLILHFNANADVNGEIPFEVIYSVERSEHRIGNEESLDEHANEQFTKASSFVPIDAGLLAKILDANIVDDELGRGRQLYDAVNDHMKYDKPAGEAWGRGDANWACDNGFGNCTDFHSLFIASCRELSIPARFEIGFPLPPERGDGEIAGYHCWAGFAVENKWVPVDISEADKDPSMADYYYGNLTENRITFSIGRDLTLIPAQAAGPVNYLVYPYVEVDGKQHKSFSKGFHYEDL